MYINYTLEGITCTDVVAWTAGVNTGGVQVMTPVGTTVFIRDVDTFKEYSEVIIDVVAGIEVNLLIILDLGRVSTCAISCSIQVVITPVVAQAHLYTMFFIEGNKVGTVAQTG